MSPSPLRFTWMLPALALGLAASASAEPRKFDVVASRFKFEPAVIEVVEGDQVTLSLKSADTTHGLAISPFKVKKEIPKGGEVVTVEFVADKAGSFPFECSEYCGNGHRQMKGKLVVKERTK